MTAVSNQMNQHTLLDVAVLRAELLPEIDVVLCKHWPDGRGIVIHFRHKGRLYLKVRGICESQHYRDEIRYRLSHGDYAPSRCEYCGELIVK